MIPVSSSRTLLTLGASLLAAALLTPTAKAGHDDDLVELAHELRDLTGELNREFALHFSQTSLYRHLLADSARIQEEAAHIDQLSHNPHVSIPHLRNDIEQLDQLSHHLHELVDLADSRRYGYVHGCTTHLHELMEEITEVIHEMGEEVDDLVRDSHRGYPHGTAPLPSPYSSYPVPHVPHGTSGPSYGNVHVPHGSGYGGHGTGHAPHGHVPPSAGHCSSEYRTFTFGNGRFSIRFR